LCRCTAYYAVCPTVQLLDENAAFSGGISIAGDGLYLAAAAAEAIVTTSMSAKHVIPTA
jgi:hypothetical protein